MRLKRTSSYWELIDGGPSHQTGTDGGKFANQPWPVKGCCAFEEEEVQNIF